MSSFPRHRLASGQTAMDWIDDWEEPDADVAYEPTAYVKRTSSNSNDNTGHYKGAPIL